MRIRQVKPAFWSDRAMASLPEPTRLFYIGLWGIADDGGFLDDSTAEIAGELYRYEPVKRREIRVEDMLSQLIAAERVVRHECGHLEVPRLAEHQHLAGAMKQVRTTMNEHLRKCLSPQIPAETREGPRVPDDPRPVKGNGQVMVRSEKVSNGKVDAREAQNETTGTGEFKTRVAALGFDPSRIGS